MRRKSNFWGLTLIFIALTMIGSMLGLYKTASIWTVAWTIIIAAFAVSALFKRNLISASIAIAIALHINAATLGISQHVKAIYPTAILLGIGLTMVLPKKRSNPKITIDIDGDRENSHFSKSAKSDDRDHIEIENNFGDNIRYLKSDNLTSVEIENNLGSTRVYFDQATFNPSGCNVYVENNLGKTTLYFPKNVNMQADIEVSLGSVKGDNSFYTDAAYPNIFLKGECSMGEIEIIYI